MRFLLMSLATLALAATNAAGAVLQTDTFDAGAQGWVTGGGLVAHHPAGGATGGFASVTSFTHLAMYNNDVRWTGSFTAVDAARVIVDLMTPVSTAEQPTAPLEMRIVLFGAGDPRGADRWTSVVSQVVPNDGVWRSFTFPLGPADIVAPGSPAASYSAIMAGVGRLMFRHDAGVPNHTLDDATDTVASVLAIDNAQLALAEPTEPTPGDFTGDMIVDAADLNDPVDGWRVRYGNDLDGHAFLDWQRNLGAGATTTAAEPAPEPGTLTLGLAAAALVTSRRRTMSAIK